jgi:hypothetical protein
MKSRCLSSRAGTAVCGGGERESERSLLARLRNEGAEVIGNTPDEAAAIVRTDLEKWGEVIKRAGISVE